VSGEHRLQIMYMHFNYIQCLTNRLSKTISQTASNEKTYKKSYV